MKERQKKYDFFISHASEDKKSFVRPLAKELMKLGFKVWYDEFTLKMGDSLFEEISNGIKNSKYGIVVISKKFFEKEWTKKELQGLFSKEIFTNSNLILPIWLEIDAKEVYTFSPILADKMSIPVKKNEIDKALTAILEKSNVETIDCKTVYNKIKFLNDCNIYERKKYVIDTESRIKNLVFFQEAYYEWFCSDEAFGYEEWNDFIALKKQREMMNSYNLPFDVTYNPEFSSIKIMNQIIKLAKKWINKKATTTEIYELIFLIDWYHEMDLPYILFGFSQDSLSDEKAYDFCFSSPYMLSSEKVSEKEIEKAQIEIYSEYYGN